MTYERIKERYLKNYITDAQLERFKALGIITEAQYTELFAASKNSPKRSPAEIR